MLLFRGPWGNVLHTGDARLSPEVVASVQRVLGRLPPEGCDDDEEEDGAHDSEDEEAGCRGWAGTGAARWQGRGEDLDFLYADCTFADLPLDFPSREEAVRQAEAAIRAAGPLHRVFLASDLLGTEALVAMVDRAFGQPLYVPPPEKWREVRRRRAEIARLVPSLRLSDDPACVFHLCGVRDFRNRGLARSGSSGGGGSGARAKSRSASPARGGDGGAEELPPVVAEACGAGSGGGGRCMFLRGSTQIFAKRIRDGYARPSERLSVRGAAPAPSAAMADRAVHYVLFALHSSRSELAAALAALRPCAMAPITADMAGCVSSVVLELAAGRGERAEVVLDGMRRACREAAARAASVAAVTKAEEGETVEEEEELGREEDGGWEVGARAAGCGVWAGAPGGEEEEATWEAGLEGVRVAAEWGRWGGAISCLPTDPGCSSIAGDEGEEGEGYMGEEEREEWLAGCGSPPASPPLPDWRHLDEEPPPPRPPASGLQLPLPPLPPKPVQAATLAAAAAAATRGLDPTGPGRGAPAPPTPHRLCGRRRPRVALLSGLLGLPPPPPPVLPSPPATGQAFGASAAGGGATLWPWSGSQRPAHTGGTQRGPVLGSSQGPAATLSRGAAASGGGGVPRARRHLPTVGFLSGLRGPLAAARAGRGAAAAAATANTAACLGVACESPALEALVPLTAKAVVLGAPVTAGRHASACSGTGAGAALLVHAGPRTEQPRRSPLGATQPASSPRQGPAPAGSRSPRGCGRENQAPRGSPGALSKQGPLCPASPRPPLSGCVGATPPLGSSTAGLAAGVSPHQVPNCAKEGGSWAKRSGAEPVGPGNLAMASAQGLPVAAATAPPSRVLHERERGVHAGVGASIGPSGDPQCVWPAAGSQAWPGQPLGGVAVSQDAARRAAKRARMGGSISGGAAGVQQR
ncbi:hypothetical protein HYH03_019198 [Edaphochlamys debaryana]|uniref:Uncharacterized protein n=1 Tax=Edaphochlamys debaryana TaxID=47281 RepID=A0A835XIN5_9CHLO|nr:hypothetical protein HYH03_019198 [Edaphochlamys debaryana]|eukprot:KAG2481835.1 hypothetical protein HYH03_019198 [Edaphochlamys debaryana]